MHSTSFVIDSLIHLVLTPVTVTGVGNAAGDFSGFAHLKRVETPQQVDCTRWSSSGEAVTSSSSANPDLAC